MPRILILYEYATLNGGEHSLLAIVDHVRREGFELVAAGPSHGPFARRLAEQAVALISFEIHSVSGIRRSQDELRGQLREVLTGSAPDLLHANSLSMSRLSGPVVQQMCVPSIGHVRDIVKLSAAAIADVNCHTRIIAVSQATRSWHVAHGMSEEKTHVVYNGVDLNKFQPRPATGYLHDELGLPRSPHLVGAIGQIGMRKGLDILFKAAERVVEGRDVHFIIVGQRHSQKREASEYEAELRRLAGDTPLAGRVHFLGTRDDIDRMLNELTLLVHAARQEPLGRVLLEGAAAGVPIIATDVGGTREIFSDGKSARIIPSESVDELAKAMGDLLDSVELQRELSMTARQCAIDTFAAPSAAAALVEHYRECLT